MPDYPDVYGWPVPPAITPLTGCPELLHYDTLQTSRAWPVANKALFFPFWIERFVTVYQGSFQPGNTPAGNMDVGVYDLYGNRIVSSGSTVSNVSAFAAAFTATVLKPGYYFLAAAMDSTNNLNAGAPNFALLQAFGICEMATAFPLPATATLARITSSYAPQVAVHFRSVV